VPDCRRALKEGIDEDQARSRKELGEAICKELSCGSGLKDLIRSLTSASVPIPPLAIIVPEISDARKRVTHPMRLLRNQFRLYFLCSHTMQIAPSGPQGDGYSIQVTKQWLQDAGPVLLVGMTLLEEALKYAYGQLPVYFPLGWRRFLGSCNPQLTERYFESALESVAHPSDDGAPGAEYELPKTLHRKFHRRWQNEWRRMSMNRRRMGDVSEPLEKYRKAHEIIRELLVAQGHDIAKTCGLRQVTCSRTTRTAWVLDDGATEQAWREEEEKTAPASAARTTATVRTSDATPDESAADSSGVASAGAAVGNAADTTPFPPACPVPREFDSEDEDAEERTCSVS
jgi:hypothetical protein